MKQCYRHFDHMGFCACGVGTAPMRNWWRSPSKRRGFCPACGARRMAETAAHLVEQVIPHVPVRQWRRLVSHPSAASVCHPAAAALSRVAGDSPLNANTLTVSISPVAE